MLHVYGGPGPDPDKSPFDVGKATFLSNYLSSLQKTDPNLMEFFVSEAKKRNLLSSRAEKQLLQHDGSTSKQPQTSAYGNEISIQNAMKVPKEYKFG